MINKLIKDSSRNEQKVHLKKKLKSRAEKLAHNFDNSKRGKRPPHEEVFFKTEIKEVEI